MTEDHAVASKTTAAASQAGYIEDLLNDEPSTPRSPTTKSRSIEGELDLLMDDSQEEEQDGGSWWWYGETKS